MPPAILSVVLGLCGLHVLLIVAVLITPRNRKY